ncbi:hypothetical protein C477_11012 [Haloterrigena salina JCM 13891]|uniref:Peptidase M50 n=1 Tax=Haloterrigena salina JCM 13891 TaxID=1227488 RepID=M0C370_9EURY|nr:hypothetical protein [Haloterrigena salina]ELZ17736.1 hypothetical protein C477_11012 [Haloterrigena salina JCM 13891]
MSLALVVLAYLVVVPLLVLGHELAHAAMGLALLPGTVRVTVGSDPRWELSLGRLEISLDPSGWRSWWPGYCRTETAPEGYRGAAFVLIGPISSLVFAVGLLDAASMATEAVTIVCQAGAYWAFISVLATAVPVTYPDWMPAYGGHPSDGKQAIRYLRE